MNNSIVFFLLSILAIVFCIAEAAVTAKYQNKDKESWETPEGLRLEVNSAKDLTIMASGRFLSSVAEDVGNGSWTFHKGVTVGVSSASTLFLKVPGALVLSISKPGEVFLDYAVPVLKAFQDGVESLAKELAQGFFSAFAVLALIPGLIHFLATGVLNAMVIFKKAFHYLNNS